MYEEQPADETTSIVCKSCGWKGVVAQVKWDWTKEDLSDLIGCCPKCKKDLKEETNGI
jgi:hypothetical protein